jgi:Family of unknown function (DUF6188)
MYGLLPDINLAFLYNKVLLQVCIGLNELILNFEDSTSITIICPITISATNRRQQVYEDHRRAVSPIVSLLGQSIAKSVSHPDGTLKLTFSGGCSLTLHDDSNNYESYSIKCGESLIVV